MGSDTLAVAGGIAFFVVVTRTTSVQQ